MQKDEEHLISIHFGSHAQAAPTLGELLKHTPGLSRHFICTAQARQHSAIGGKMSHSSQELLGSYRLHISHGVGTGI